MTTLPKPAPPGSGFQYDAPRAAIGRILAKLGA